MSNFFQTPARFNDTPTNVAARKAQEIRRQQDLAYVELNNLYLAIERGTVKMSIHTDNRLNILAGQAYPYLDPMCDYWTKEFQKLPGYLSV